VAGRCVTAANWNVGTDLEVWHRSRGPRSPGAPSIASADTSVSAVSPALLAPVIASPAKSSVGPISSAVANVEATNPGGARLDQWLSRGAPTTSQGGSLHREGNRRQRANTVR